MIKSHRILRATAVGAVGMLGLVACSPAENGGGGAAGGSLEDMEPITITVADVDPASGPVGQAWLELAEEVERESDGKITVETYLADSLFTHDETLDGVGSGTAHLSRLSPNLTPEELPVINWYMNFGSLFSNSFPHGLLQSSGVAAEVHTQSPEIVEELDQHNLVPLTGAAIAQEYSILCNTEVTSAEDLEGMRVRTGGEPWASELQSLGMRPTSLISPEAYEGLQRGTIDCTSADTYQFMSYGFVEVADQYVPVHMTPPLNNVYVVNQDLWESLPEDGKEVISTAIENLWTDIMEAYLLAYSEFAEVVEERDMTVVDATDMNEILLEHQEGVGSSLESMAPDAVEDPGAFLEEVEGLSEEWMDVVVEGTGIEPGDRDYSQLMDDFAAVKDINLDFYQEEAQERVFENGE